MPASAVSSPTAVTRTRIAESVATVPAVTLSPSPLATGFDSPVIIDSSSSARPATISPSAGTRAPGRTSTTSPTRSSSSEHSLRLPVAHALGLVREQLRERAQRATGLTERLHLLPVPEQHDHDERRQLPPELEVEEAERRRCAREEGDGDRERDEQHHPGRALAKLRPGAGQEDGAAVEEDDRAEHRRDQAVARELGRREAEPVLDHLAVEDDRDREDQGDPEAAPVHVRVPELTGVFVFLPVTGVFRGPAQLALVRRMAGVVAHLRASRTDERQGELGHADELPGHVVGGALGELPPGALGLAAVPCETRDRLEVGVEHDDAFRTGRLGDQRVQRPLGRDEPAARLSIAVVHDDERDRRSPGRSARTVGCSACRRTR